MLENLKEMSQEEAQKRIKELNREIRKHEIVFILFIVLGITNIVLTILGFISFNVISVLMVLGCVLACRGIFKFSESFEVEKYFIELIFGKNGK
jgi:uncharacterized membrane protein HdeD (DUF308 family)